MGDQQNPDGIYVPPGVNKRYPLNYPASLLRDKRCKCGVDVFENRDASNRVISKKYSLVYNPECDQHGQIGAS